MNKLILFLENNDTIKTEIFPILDDFTMETNSKFSSLGEFAGSIQQMTNLITAYQGSSGKLSQGTVQLQNVLNLQRYESTEPLKVTLEIVTFTKEDAKKDVVDKINLLLRLHLPYYDANKNQILIPGVTGYNINETTKVTNNAKTAEKAKMQVKSKQTETQTSNNLQNINTVFSFGIPGVCFVQYGFLSSIQVSYSRHTTFNGYPIWARVQLQLSSIGACLVNNFEWGAEKFVIKATDLAQQPIKNPFATQPQSTSGNPQLQ